MNYIFYESNYDNLKNIFLHRKDIYSDDYIKLYIKLKYSINSYYDKKIDEICNNLNTNTIIDNLHGSYDNDITDDEQSEILQDIDLEIDEREKIQYMSNLIENGVVDFESRIKSKYNMNDDDYIDFITKVKTKILSNRY